jgi:curved DNA-binding protein
VATAALGGEKEVNTLSGKLKVKIPAGAQNEQVLKVKGKGMPAYNNEASRGDLLLEIFVDIPGTSPKNSRNYSNSYRQVLPTTKLLCEVSII